ncbi:MAG: response regulator, partial [Arenibacter algicola]|nr:response regulator [Arenibacter algicola]
IYNLNEEIITQEIKDEENKPGSLSSKSVQQVFRNSNGVIFVSTWRGGLNVYSPGKLNFQFLKHYPFGLNSLRNNVVMMLEEISPGVIGFGTDKGLSIWNKQNKTWQYVDIQLADAIHMSNSKSISVDKNANIWATSYTDSLVLFKKNSKGEYYSTKDFHPDLKGLNFAEVHAGPNDLVWFSNNNKDGIWYYSITSQKVGRYEFALDNVQTMLAISQDRLAVGTATGLHLIDTKNRKLDELDIINASRLKTSMISSLTVDANKQLWIGTRYEGLFVINFFKNTLTRLTTEDGLLSNRIFALTSDKENIWASTSRGISRIDSKNDISNFTESDGLISVDFNYKAALKDTEGLLYFGTNEGAITFDPNDIHPVKSNKSLVLDEFFLNHKRVLSGTDSPLDQPLNETDLIELNHDQNSFSIGFSSIDFLHSDQGDFQWKLENFDDEWITNHEGTSVASYTNLNPGNYIFRLRMLDQKEELIGNEKQVELIVLPPFWSTPWAFLIYFVFGLLLFALIIYSNGLRIKSNHSREKLHYLVNMAHEIKTPLMLITAPLTDLLKNNKLDATMQQGLQIALKNADLLHRQMVQFLDFKRLNIRKKDLSLDPIDVVQLLRDKVFAFKVLADKKNIDFSLKSNLPDLVVNTDEKILDKVVSNLISNAIKYTNSGGKIVVELIGKKDSCKILVKDTGIGIPLGQRRKVFQLFYRTPNARESGSTGSGVGLVLASDLAQLIRGKVSLEESSSQGSIFSFMFPFERSNIIDKAIQLQANNLEQNDEMDSIPQSRIKVLLVEDNEDFREYSKSKLSDKFNVTTAPNGQVALDILKKEPQDIVVTDVMMPKMNGRQLCMNLKKNIETCHVPVILLTGLGSKEHIMQGLECGADDYIVKPYDYDLLISKIEALLQNRSVLKRKFLFHDDEEGEMEFSNALDKEFVSKITQFIEDNISDSNVSPKDLCDLMGMSRTSFYHKLKALMDVSPNEFIR